MGDIACAICVIATELAIIVGSCLVFNHLTNPERQAWRNGNKAYAVGSYNIAYENYFNATLIHNQKIDKKITEYQLKAQKAKNNNKLAKAHKYTMKAMKLESKKLPMPVLGQNHYEMCFDPMNAATVPIPINMNQNNNNNINDINPIIPQQQQQRYAVFYLNDPTWPPVSNNENNNSEGNAGPQPPNRKGYHLSDEPLKQKS